MARDASASLAPTGAVLSTNDAAFNVVFAKVLEFLSSKSFTDTESALRKEVQGLLAKGMAPADFNQFTSELERDLFLSISLPTKVSMPVDETPVITSTTGTTPQKRAWEQVTLNKPELQGAALHLQCIECPVPLFKPVPSKGPGTKDSELRDRRGRGTAREHVVFHELEAMPANEETAAAQLNMPMIFNPHISGLEDEREFNLRAGDVIAGRYRMARKLGTGSFSTSYQCFEVFEGSNARSDGPATGRWISIKILKNDKDCFDTGCAEIRLLNLIRTKDPAGVHHLLRYSIGCCTAARVPASLTIGSSLPQAPRMA